MSLINELKAEGYDTSQITPELIQQLEAEGYDTSPLQENKPVGMVEGTLGAAGESAMASNPIEMGLQMTKKVLGNEEAMAMGSRFAGAAENATPGGLAQKGFDFGGEKIAESLAPMVGPNLAALAGTTFAMLPDAIGAFAGTPIKAGAKGLSAGLKGMGREIVDDAYRPATRKIGEVIDAAKGTGAKQVELLEMKKAKEAAEIARLQAAKASDPFESQVRDLSEQALQRPLQNEVAQLSEQAKDVSVEATKRTGNLLKAKETATGTLNTAKAQARDVKSKAVALAKQEAEAKAKAAADLQSAKGSIAAVEKEMGIRFDDMTIGSNLQKAIGNKDKASKLVLRLRGIAAKGPEYIAEHATPQSIQRMRKTVEGIWKFHGQSQTFTDEAKVATAAVKKVLTRALEVKNKGYEAANASFKSAFEATKNVPKQFEAAKNELKIMMDAAQGDVAKQQAAVQKITQRYGQMKNQYSAQIAEIDSQLTKLKNASDAKAGDLKAKLEKAKALAKTREAAIDRVILRTREQVAKLDTEMLSAKQLSEKQQALLKKSKFAAKVAGGSVIAGAAATAVRRLIPKG